MLLWQLIIIQVVTFIALIFFLRMLFYRHLNFALKRLQRLHQENLEREAALNRELEAAKEERKREVEKGRLEASKLKEEAKLEVERLKSEVASKAKEEAKGILVTANKEIERVKKATQQEMEKTAIKMACELIKSIFGQEDKEIIHLKFIEEMFSEIEGLQDDRLRVETDKAEVTVAHTLNERHRELLRQILNKKLGHDVQLTIKIDANIIAGLIITLDRLVLDGSLQNRLRRMIPYLALPKE